MAIAALSHEHERPYSATIFYLGFGLLGALALNALGVEPLDPLGGGERVLEHLTEIALVVAVFAAGLSVGRGWPRGSWTTVAVLLLVVMPLTIAVVALFGFYAMGLSLGAAILLGAILAPTDPVLAGELGLPGPDPDAAAEGRFQADDHGEPRFSLHTEAGINDGLASPFVIIGLLVAGEGGSDWIGSWLLADVLWAIAASAAIGAALGWGMSALTGKLRERDFLSHDYDSYVAIATPLLAYGAAELLDSYGLLAVFMAGLAFRRHDYTSMVNRRVYDGAEDVGTVFELAVILLLGSLVTIAGLQAPGVAGWLLAPVLIVFIRPLLVMATSGFGVMRPRDRLFLGLFGVRGVAALFYASIMVHEEVLDPAETSVVFWTTAAVVMVSVVVHGIAATPLERKLLAPSGSDAG